MYRYVFSGLLMSASFFSCADVLGVVVGAESWRADTKLSLIGTPASLKADATRAQQSFYFRFEHPLPLLPNIAVRQQQLSFNQGMTPSTSLSFAKQSFDASSTVQLGSSGRWREVVAYYELFDNPLFDIDLGLAWRQLDLQLSATATNGAVFNQTVDRWRPALYGNVALALWGTDTKLFGQTTYSDVRGDLTREWRAGIAWRWLDLTPVQSSVLVGYRHVQLELDDIGASTAEFRQQGPYLALEFDF